MDFQEDFIDFLTDSTSARADDYLALVPSPPFWEDDQVWGYESALSEPSESNVMKVICKVCQKNTVDIEHEAQLGHKRRKLDIDALPASQLICSECLSLTTEQISSLRAIPDKSVLLLKRVKAKRMTQANLDLLKAEETQVLAKAENLPLQEQRRLKQKMRNRITAQQSRDRKRTHTLELEKENYALKEDNHQLRERVLELEQENARLRSVSASLAFGGRGGLSRTESVSIALGALVIVCLIGSLAQPAPTFEVKTVARHLQSLPDNSQIDISESYGDYLENSHALALPDQQMQYVLPRNFRKPHINQKSSFLPKADPCGYPWGADAELPDSVTTLFCPKVQAYINNDSAALTHIQLLTPLEALPSLSIKPDDSLMEHTNYLVEILCAVTTVNIVPFSPGF